MRLLTDPLPISRHFASHIRDVRRLLDFHGLSHGFPADFLQLAPRLTSSEGFRLDVSELARTIRDREHGAITAAEIFTIFAIATAGEDVVHAEQEIDGAAGMLVVLLAGVGGWAETSSIPAPRPAIPAHFSSRHGNGDGSSGAHPVPLRPDARNSAANGAPGASDMKATLARLELASMQLKVYLDDIDRRMGRIEPQLEDMAQGSSPAQAASSNWAGSPTQVAGDASPHLAPRSHRRTDEAIAEAMALSHFQPEWGKAELPPEPHTFQTYEAGGQSSATHEGGISDLAEPGFGEVENVESPSSPESLGSLGSLEDTDQLGAIHDGQLLQPLESAETEESTNEPAAAPPADLLGAPEAVAIPEAISAPEPIAAPQPIGEPEIHSRAARPEEVELLRAHPPSAAESNEAPAADQATLSEISAWALTEADAETQTEFQTEFPAPEVPQHAAEASPAISQLAPNPREVQDFEATEPQDQAVSQVREPVPDPVSATPELPEPTPSDPRPRDLELRTAQPAPRFALELAADAEPAPTPQLPLSSAPTETPVASATPASDGKQSSLAPPEQTPDQLPTELPHNVSDKRAVQGPDKLAAEPPEKSVAEASDKDSDELPDELPAWRTPRISAYSTSKFVPPPFEETGPDTTRERTRPREATANGLHLSPRPEARSGQAAVAPRVAPLTSVAQVSSLSTSPQKPAAPVTATADSWPATSSSEADLLASFRNAQPAEPEPRPRRARPSFKPSPGIAKAGAIAAGVLVVATATGLYLRSSTASSTAAPTNSAAVSEARVDAPPVPESTPRNPKKRISPDRNAGASLAGRAPEASRPSSSARSSPSSMPGNPAGSTAGNSTSAPQPSAPSATPGNTSGPPPAEVIRPAPQPPVARVEGARAEDTPHPPRIEVIHPTDGATPTATEAGAPAPGANTLATAAGAPAPSGSPAPSPAAAAGTGDVGRPSSGPLNVSAVALKHNLIAAPKPEYPLGAKFLGVQGTVIVQAMVGKDGKVKDAHALVGPSALIASAVETVRHRRYKPLMVAGVPTEFQTEVVLVYHLKDAR